MREKVSKKNLKTWLIGQSKRELLKQKMIVLTEKIMKKKRNRLDLAKEMTQNRK